MNNTLTVTLDCALDASEVAEFSTWLQNTYNLACEIYPDSVYEGLAITGTRENILNYILAPDGYAADLAFVQEFYPELVA